MYSWKCLFLKSVATLFSHSQSSLRSQSNPLSSNPGNNTQHTHSVSHPILSPSHLFSPLLHTSSINHSTLNSDWRHSQGLALLAMLPSEYNSRPFCLPKWTLRGSPSLSKDPQITSEKGWVMGGFCRDGGSEQGRGGRRVTGKWLGRSTAPGELCSLSLWTARNAISYCLATSGFGLIDWKTPKKVKESIRKIFKSQQTKELIEIQKAERLLQSQNCVQLWRTKAGADRWKKRKMGPCRLLDSGTTRTWLYILLSCTNKRQQTGVNHGSHSADIMSQFVTGQEYYFLILWSWSLRCLCTLVCVWKGVSNSKMAPKLKHTQVHL